MNNFLSIIEIIIKKNKKEKKHETNKQTILTKTAALVLALFSLAACKGQSDAKDADKPVFYLANTKTISLAEKNGPESVLQTTQEGMYYSVYKIGTQENVYIQNLLQPFYIDDAVSEIEYEYQEINTESISKGISNSISKTKSTTITQENSSSKITLNVNENNGTSGSGNFWTNLGMDLCSIAFSSATNNYLSILQDISKKCSIGITTQKQSEAITESITSNIEEKLETSSTVSNIKISKIKFDADKLEKNKYYTVALIGDFDIYQIFQYDLTTHNYVTYFLTILNKDNLGYKRVWSDTRNFPITEEFKITPIESLDIDLSKETGDGTPEKPFRIYNWDNFRKIKDNTSAHYKLEKDLDLQGATLTKFGDTFTGSIDGNNHKISNFTMKDGNQSYFFKNNSGTIKNLVLWDFKVIHTKEGAGICLVNDSNGIIENVMLYNATFDIPKKNENNSYNYGICSENKGMLRNIMILNSKLKFNGDLIYWKSKNYNYGIAKTNNGTIENVIFRNNYLYSKWGWGGQICNDDCQYGLVHTNNHIIKNAISAENTASWSGDKKDNKYVATVKNNKGQPLVNVINLNDAKYNTITNKYKEFGKDVNPDFFDAEKDGYIILSCFQNYFKKVESNE